MFLTVVLLLVVVLNVDDVIDNNDDGYIDYLKHHQCYEHLSSSISLSIFLSISSSNKPDKEIYP